CEGQIADVRVAEPAIDAEQNHRLERLPGGAQNPPQFRRFEHLQSASGPCFPNGLSVWPPKRFAEEDGFFNQAVLECVAEDDTHPVDFVAEPHWAPGPCKTDS